MKKLLALFTICAGLYLIFSTIKAFDSSNHMGSFLNQNDHFVECLKNDQHSNNADAVKRRIESLLSEGRNGFDLLGQALKTQLLSGLLFIILGICFYPGALKTGTASNH